ncbi:MAG: inositol monophosphatase [Bacteroidales bacterium]|nr:inositol monophosphatase [Bacteroidales bacterium]
MNIQLIGNAALELVRKAGRFIKEERSKFDTDRIESKGKHNFVTYVDKKAEQLLVNGLHEVLPEAGFIAEEGTSTDGGEKYRWVIDPLDGTTNFIHGAPPYSISVALMEDEGVILGIVHEIVSGEMFYSFGNQEAFLDGKPIRVSKAEKLSDSLIATGFPYSNYDRMKPFMDSLGYFFLNSHGVRRLGSAAMDLAYVACGRYDSFYEYNLNPWDVAAGAFLVQQAGGKVGDFKAGGNYIFGGEIVAANDLVYAEFVHKVGEFMNS